MEFVERCESRYAHTYSFAMKHTQEDILCLRLLGDPDKMHHYQDLSNESQEVPYRVYAQNPIHLGFFLSAIWQESEHFSISSSWIEVAVIEVAVGLK